MRETAKRLKISHSTISRYKNKVYKKCEMGLEEKYKFFLDYFEKNYDRCDCSIEVCVHQFKKFHSNKPHVSINKSIVGLMRIRLVLRLIRCAQRGVREKEKGMEW